MGCLRLQTLIQIMRLLHRSLPGAFFRQSVMVTDGTCMRDTNQHPISDDGNGLPQNADADPEDDVATTTNRLLQAVCDGDQRYLCSSQKA